MRIEAPLQHTIPFNYWISDVYISDDGKVVAVSFPGGYSLIRVDEGEVLMRKVGGTKISMIPSKNILIVGVEDTLSFYNLIGTLLWKESLSSEIRDLCSAENGTVIVATKNEVVCYTNFHNVLWKRGGGGDKVVMDSSGRYFALVKEKSVKFCDTTNAQKIWEREFLEEIADIKIQRGGHRVLISLTNGDIFLFNKMGAIYWEYKLKYVPKVAFDFSGNIVVGEGKNVKIFNDRGTVLKSWTLDDTVNFVETASKAQYILAGTKNGTVYFLNRDGIIWDFKHVHPILSGSISPYGEYVVAANKHILLFSNINYYEEILLESDKSIRKLMSSGYDVRRLMEIYQKMKNAFIKKDFDIFMSYKRAFDNVISKTTKSIIEYAIFADKVFSKSRISRINFHLKGEKNLRITDIKVYGKVKYKSKIFKLSDGFVKGVIYIMPLFSGDGVIEIAITYRHDGETGEIRQRIFINVDGKERKVKVYSNTDYRKLLKEEDSLRRR